MAILWIPDSGGNDHHERDESPALILGRAGGALAGNRFLKLPKADIQSDGGNRPLCKNPGESHALNDLHITLAHAYGHPIDTYGHELNLSRGPLPHALV